MLYELDVELTDLLAGDDFGPLLGDVERSRPGNADGLLAGKFNCKACGLAEGDLDGLGATVRMLAINCKTIFNNTL